MRGFVDEAAPMLQGLVDGLRTSRPAAIDTASGFLLSRRRAKMSALMNVPIGSSRQ
jgi:hypothetical protein